MIVVDASVAIKWTVKEAGHESALRLLAAAKDITAPDLIISEVTNAFRKKVKAGELEATQARQSIAFTSEAFEQFLPAREVADLALSLSLAMDHSAYDCVYLACAFHWGGTLVTADERFRQRCASAGYANAALTIDEWLARPLLDEAGIADVVRLSAKVQQLFGRYLSDWVSRVGNRASAWWMQRLFNQLSILRPTVT